MSADPYPIFVDLRGLNESTFRGLFQRFLSENRSTHPMTLRRIIVSQVRCSQISKRLGFLFDPILASVTTAVAGLLTIAFYLSPSPPYTRFTALDIAAGYVIALCGVLVHEMGHVSACETFGARQKGIGIGLYWIWPAFYADVRHAWVLDNKHRAAVSAAGLYFQTLFCALWASTYLVFPLPCFYIALQTSLLAMFTTLNPIFKYDGYWIICDLTRSTNIHARVSAQAFSLVSGSIPFRLWLRQPSTWLALIFLLCAGAYMTYVAIAMSKVLLFTASNLPILWKDLVNRIFAFDSSPIDVALSFANMVLGVSFTILICAGLAVLFHRALTTMAATFNRR